MPIGLPSAVGSLAVAAAASGAVTMPQALGATTLIASDSLTTVPERPHATDITGALAPVEAAGESLTAESAQLAKDVNAVLVEVERKEAAERAARAERERKMWVLPLESYRISAGFGTVGRLWASRHTGLDLSTSYGSPVRAMSSGEIVFAGWDGPFGNKIVIRHWDGTETWYYAHRAGLPVRIWTVDDREDMVRLLGWGADSVISDRPDIAVPVVREWVSPPSRGASRRS